MNAPLNDAVRQALENVTLDDKPQCGLVHKYTLGCAAAQGGRGIQPFAQGGL